MKRITGILILIIIILAAPVYAFADTQAYIIDTDSMDRIPIPLTYKVDYIIRNMGDYGFMNHPEDLHIDKWDNIYVADTENNRIVKLDRDGNVIAVYTEYEGRALKTPKGIFVDDDGVLWIADTGNQRIVTINPDGTERKTYVKPNSTLLGDGFTFDPSRIWVSSAGYIYILRGTNLFSIDESNNFRGFIGAKEVGFNLTRTLIRMFGTQSQKDRTLKQAPDSYSSFVIADDGMIYGALSNSNEDQVRRLNSVNKNTYAKGFYGEYTSAGQDRGFSIPSFSDIHVNSYGIITISERISGRIYQYDQEGNLLMAFGDIGDYKGTFSIATALDFDSDGNLYVLDYNTNMIQVFKPTDFLKNIHEAVYLHSEGKYDEAKQYWEKVLSIHSNYTVAHKGIAKVNFKEQDWASSMEHYLLANDVKGYSKAYSQYRHQIFRENFFLVVIIFVVIIAAFIKIFLFLKRKSGALAFNIVMKKGAVFK